MHHRQRQAYMVGNGAIHNTSSQNLRKERYERLWTIFLHYGDGHRRKPTVGCTSFTSSGTQHRYFRWKVCLSFLMWLVAIPPRIAVCPTNERALFGNLDNMAFEFEARILTTLKLDKLQSFQRDVLSALSKRRGVFVSIKTGRGKSLCYQTYTTASSPGSLCTGLHPGAIYFLFCQFVLKWILFKI